MIIILFKWWFLPWFIFQFLSFRLAWLSATLLLSVSLMSAKVTHEQLGQFAALHCCIKADLNRRNVNVMRVNSISRGALDIYYTHERHRLAHRSWFRVFSRMGKPLVSVSLWSAWRRLCLTWQSRMDSTCEVWTHRNVYIILVISNMILCLTPRLAYTCILFHGHNTRPLNVHNQIYERWFSNVP